MQYQFEYDATSDTVTATVLQIRTSTQVEALLERGVPKRGLRNNLALFANADELDGIETDWWALQQTIQDAPAPASVADEIARRDDLETSNPWLPGYRGQSAPARPDVSAPVLDACKDYAARWFVQTGERRAVSREVTVSGKTFVMNNTARRVISDMACLIAAGGAYANLKLRKTDGSYATFAQADFTALAQAASDESRTANNWIAGNVASITAATTVDEVLAVLS